jgi:hypothetical protein
VRDDEDAPSEAFTQFISANDLDWARGGFGAAAPAAAPADPNDPVDAFMSAAVSIAPTAACRGRPDGARRRAAAPSCLGHGGDGREPRAGEIADGCGIDQPAGGRQQPDQILPHP